MLSLLRRLLPDPQAQELRAISRVAREAEALESTFSGMSDDELRARAGQLRQSVISNRSSGEKSPLPMTDDSSPGAALWLPATSSDEKSARQKDLRSALDPVLPEALALVREAARRVTGEFAYPVQLVGAITLHRGLIAEMKTGEGKTLVGTLAIFIQALLGRGVHVITVNEYLAARDFETYGEVLRFLGLTTGLLRNALVGPERQEVYRADVTYGTTAEFGFDYLRDNMARRPEDQVQRGLHFALVDEVDSVLIDEARTPLIISAPAAEASEMYKKFDQVVQTLRRGEIVSPDARGLDKLASRRELPETTGDFIVDEKGKIAILTDEGMARCEQLLGIENLYSPENYATLHHLETALKARFAWERDRDYVVAEDGALLLIDHNTGRMMPGRRLSDGLHQALEAKEGVEIRRESMTVASVTIQNYFRMYDRLAGMTGTAKTDEEEFAAIYGLGVLQIPTHRPIARQDLPDAIFPSVQGKFAATVREIRRRHELGQPVLVGTVSIDASEALSAELAKAGIPHEVLNAKQHAREAEIISRAGEVGAVTIATNMAGRGTDIKLPVGLNAEIARRAASSASSAAAEGVRVQIIASDEGSFSRLAEAAGE